MSQELKVKLDKAIQTLSTIILGKEAQIRLAICCILAKGHLLIEDLPGMGKTTLAHALAKVLGLEFQRIQFTSDILPGDITGSSIYKRSEEAFEFYKGPIFTQVVLTDEINRASPKSQSALLEAMEEGQVTVDGTTYELPTPFFVVATQNSFHQIGTYPLPESQLDRFLIKISLGYPDRDNERQLLSGQSTRKKIETLNRTLDSNELSEIQEKIDSMTVSEALYDYLQDLIDATRKSASFSHGLSPRAGLAVLNSAKAWAFMQSREFVIPEDIQSVWSAVTQHRLINQSNDFLEQKDGKISTVNAILKNTPIPR